jgi:hypothetical protein
LTEAFAADWLALREPFDAQARSASLADAFAAALPAFPRVLDMGAGTGSLFRWLAPLIGRDQHWILADADAGLLERALEDIAAWALELGAEAEFHPGALLLETPLGTWRVETRLTDLSAGAPDLSGQDGVVCSALLDLVSAAWIERLAASLDIPLLACLSVDGRDVMLPPHALDGVVRGAFRRDQGRDKGFGRALGPSAPATLRRTLESHGLHVRSAPSDWRIPAFATAMLLELTHSAANVATLHLPARRAAIRAWERTRQRQIAAHRLAIRVGHRDILALPKTPD